MRTYIFDTPFKGGRGFVPLPLHRAALIKCDVYIAIARILYGTGRAKGKPTKKDYCQDNFTNFCKYKTGGLLLENAHHHHHHYTYKTRIINRTVYANRNPGATSSHSSLNDVSIINVPHSVCCFNRKRTAYSWWWRVVVLPYIPILSRKTNRQQLELRAASRRRGRNSKPSSSQFSRARTLLCV